MQFLIYRFLIVLVLTFPFTLVGKTSFPAGVYMSVDELLSKKPSYLQKLEVVPRNARELTRSGGNDYKAISVHGNVKRSFIKNKVVAISDGTDLYVNGKVFECGKWFAKVIVEGKYLAYYGAPSRLVEIYEGVKHTSINNTARESASYNSSKFAEGSSFINRKRWLYAYDTESKEALHISNSKMSKLLMKFDQLMAQWEMLSKKERKSNRIYFLENINATYQ